MSTVNIAGLDKGTILHALWKNSQAIGMGVLHDRSDITVEECQKVVETALAGEPDRFSSGRKLYFDYFFGRPLKTDLTQDETESWGFDRDNGGEGALQRVIDQLRKETNSPVPVNG